MPYDGSSAMAVFEAIANSGEISRAQISEMTGFSQVTVGKVVDRLDECGIISQYKKERASVGRKTGICKMNNSFGMMLFDFNSMQMRVTDISLAEHGEYDLGDLGEALLEGFTHFTEAFGGELMGIGCIVPDGQLSEYTEKITTAFGQMPELVIEAGKAAAIANAARFDVCGTAVYLRIDKTISGAIMLGGKLYQGANGHAGDFSRMMADRDALTSKLADLCCLLDPELIHIACDEEISCEAIGDTEIVVETLENCRDALDGAALMLREKWVRAKME